MIKICDSTFPIMITFHLTSFSLWENEVRSKQKPRQMKICTPIRNGRRGKRKNKSHTLAMNSILEWPSSSLRICVLLYIFCFYSSSPYSVPKIYLPFFFSFFSSSIRNENFRLGKIIKRFSQSDFTRRLKRSSFVRFAWLLIQLNYSLTIQVSWFS